MTVHITPLGVAILAAGLLLVRVLFQYTRPDPQTLFPGSPQSGKGDLVGAVAAGAAVVTVLVLLFGGGADTAVTKDDPPTTTQEATPTPTSPVSPSPVQTDAG
ncbi:hypothetical protein [Streptomyces sp. NPDC126522]|uniref:hypothetical protein n=1 Tax=Streptomyces sp. NPDC126522 TaxID=3155211 RepID=UPI00331A0B6E